MFRAAKFGFIDCARFGGTRAFGENGVIPALFPELFLSILDSEFDGSGGRVPPIELFLSILDSEFDGSGGRVPPIEFSRLGGTRVGVICVDDIIFLPSFPHGDWGTTGRGIPFPDFDRCRFCVGDGCCNPSPDFERVNGALATDDAFDRRFGRSSSSIEDNRDLEESKPSVEWDFTKSAFLDGSGSPSPDFERLNGALATDDAFGRRFGRSSSSNEDSRDLDESKPSAE